MHRRRRYNEKVNGHELAEARSLALHEAIAERLEADPSILERARARVNGWLTSGEVAPLWARRWNEILSRPVDDIRSALIADTEEARALRQVTPFAGAIDPRTRWRIWREVRETWERAG